MSNFSVNFTVAWLLLLLIPAIILTLIPYFRMAKRYRRTRNRIISIVCHITIMVLCISVLSGMTFSYDTVNKDSEVIYVVDYSYSANSSNSVRDRFVLDSINASSGNFKVGIVAFGFKQHTVIDPSLDVDMVREEYSRFMNLDENDINDLVDNTASDISSALMYASNMITNKSGSKIVLVSDGIETDRNAINTVSDLTLLGLKVDTVSFDNRYLQNGNSSFFDAEIIDVKFDDNIKLGKNFALTITVSSNISANVQFDLKDNNSNVETITPNPEKLNPIPNNEFIFNHVFTEPGLHSLTLTLKTSVGNSDTDRTDNFDLNNTYTTYFYMQQFNKLLILEGFEDEGLSLENELGKVVSGDKEITNDITRICIDPKLSGSEQEEKLALLPQNALEMSQYYEIILANVANSDLTSEKMPKNFDEELKSYVEDYGGGLFVVGGNEDYFDESGQHPVPHAFNATDMKNAGAYAELLPVTVETYKPPVALVILVDASVSMGNRDGDKTIIEWLKDGAKALLEDGLTHRDFVSVVKFGKTVQQISPLISVKNKAPILDAIENLKADQDDTKFEPAVKEAIRILNTKGKDEVAKWHIILISDGISNEAYEQYGNLIKEAASDPETPITLSVAHLSTNATATTNMKNLAKDGNGSYYQLISGAAKQIGNYMRAELKGPNVSDFIFEKESIKVEETYYNNPILDGIDKGSDINKPYDTLPTVTGFFATREKTARKGKPQPEKILQAGYVPLYVQWQYGNGRVGAYMSSLSNGDGDGFSGNRFFDDDEGKRLIVNIVDSLLPTTDIAPKNIDVVFSKDDNYVTTMSIYPKTLEEGDNIRVKIYAPDQDPDDPNAEPQIIYWDDTARVSFDTMVPGVYKFIVEQVRKYNDDEIVVATEKFFKSFAYSKEFDSFVDKPSIDDYMSNLATAGLGNVVDADSPYSVFSNMDIVQHKTYDPRMLFIIISIVLFLLDVAVRKFKFKWIHEIIRDRKEREKLMNHNSN